MATEFDDLFNAEELTRSQGMTVSRSTLCRSEEVMDRLFSRFSGVPINTGTASDTNELVKMFQESGHEAPPRAPVNPYTPPPVFDHAHEDPLAGLMWESDRRAGGEFLKQASPQPPRHESNTSRPPHGSWRNCATI